MTTRAIITLAIQLILLFITHNGWCAQQPTQAQLDQLKKEIKTAQKRLSSNTGKEGKLEQSLQKTEKNLAHVEKDIYTLRKKILDQQKHLNNLQAEQTQLENNKDKLAQDIAHQINKSYRLGRESRIKVLLNQDDPKKLSRTLIYADYFNKSRIASIDEFKHTIERLVDLASGIENQTEALLDNKNTLVDKQKALKKSYASREKTLQQVKASISNDKSKIKKLTLDQSKLEALLASVSQAIENITLPSDSVPFSKRKGQMPWPTVGNVKNRFGHKRQPGNLRWEGLSIFANIGNNINVIHHGRVVFADWFRGKGLLLIVDHGSGYMSLYAHNQTLLRETGDWVSAGETIATLGNSGALDHAELYFEIRHQGKPLNPKIWLTKHRG